MNCLLEKESIAELQIRNDELEELIIERGISTKKFMEIANELAIISVKISNYNKSIEKSLKKK